MQTRFDENFSLELRFESLSKLFRKLGQIFSAKSRKTTPHALKREKISEKGKGRGKNSRFLVTRVLLMFTTLLEINY